MKKILGVYLLGCLIMSYAFCKDNFECGIKIESDKKLSRAYKIFKLKGGALFRGIKVRNRDAKIAYAALDENNKPYEIEGNRVYLTWTGNSTPEILKIRRYSPEEANQYVYIGLGCNVDRAMGLSFELKIGNFAEAFALEEADIPFRKMIEIEGVKYAISLIYEIEHDCWDVFSIRGGSELIEGKGYLIKIEYIKQLSEEAAENFEKDEVKRKVNEVVKRFYNAQKGVGNAENALKGTENASTYGECKRSERQILVALEEIEQALKYANVYLSKIKGNEEIKSIISQLISDRKQVLMCYKKVQLALSNIEIKVLNDVKLDKKRIQEEIKHVGDMLLSVESKIGSIYGFDSISDQIVIIIGKLNKINHIVQSARDKIYDIRQNTEAFEMDKEMEDFLDQREQFYQRCESIYNKLIQKRDVWSYGNSRWWGEETHSRTHKNTKKEETRHRKSKVKDKKNKKSKRSKSHKKTKKDRKLKKGKKTKHKKSKGTKKSKKKKKTIRKRKVRH